VRVCENERGFICSMRPWESCVIFPCGESCSVLAKSRSTPKDLLLHLLSKDCLPLLNHVLLCTVLYFYLRYEWKFGVNKAGQIIVLHK